jgi:hypothetical protein
MLNAKQADRVQRLVFSVEALTVYAVLDGALIEQLPARLRQSGLPHACLYGGELDPELEAVVPYLVQLTAAHPLAREAIETGWLSHWGVYMLAPRAFGVREARNHFRTLLRVRGPQGEEWLFRYYDPRVLRAALPTFEPAQRAEFFGPVRRCLVESETPDVVLRFDADPAQDQRIAVN